MVAQKCKPLRNYQKTYQIVLKPLSEIRFIRHIKVWSRHYNTIRGYIIFYAWPTFWPQ